MKKFGLLFSLAAFMAAGVFLGSCDKKFDELNNPKIDMKLEGSSVGALSTPTYFYYSPTSPCLGDEVTVTFDNTQGYDHSNFQMHVWGPDGSKWVGEDDGEPAWYNLKDDFTGPSGGKITFTFTPDVAGEYRFRGQWVRTGKPSDFKGESTGWQEAVLWVENCGCETALYGETKCGTFGNDDQFNRKAVYTFITEEAGGFKLQGGLTNFTGDEYEVVTSAGTVNSWTPGQSTNRIISVTGILEDCGEVVVTVYWYSTNTDDYITGDWSVELNDVKILAIDKLECDDEGEGYPPAEEE